jgi:hypothetical protein
VVSSTAWMRRANGVSDAVQGRVCTALASCRVRRAQEAQEGGVPDREEPLREGSSGGAQLARAPMIPARALSRTLRNEVGLAAPQPARRSAFGHAVQPDLLQAPTACPASWLSHVR